MRTFDPIPFPFLTEVLGMTFDLNEATIRKITEMKAKMEAGIRLKAGFDRQYNTPIPSTPAAPITETTAIAPTPTPPLMSLAQQITFQPHTPSNTPKPPTEVITKTRGTKRPLIQVPHFTHNYENNGTVPIHTYDAHLSHATNHSIAPPSKQFIATGVTTNRPAKKQRTSHPDPVERTGSTTQTRQQSTPRSRTTQRQFQAYQHRAFGRERHEVGHRRFIYGFQATMGPRASQEETHENQETFEGAPSHSSNISVPTVPSYGQRNPEHIQGHGSTTQQEQITNTVRATSIPTEPLPSPYQARTEQFPYTSEPFTATSHESQSQIRPTVQSGGASTNEGHHGTALSSIKSQDPSLTTEEHALHQSDEPVRQVLLHHSSRPESSTLNTTATTGKLHRLVSDIKNLGVNNISSYSPSHDELVVLALGLNYIPESKDVSNIEILQAFDEFSDSLLEREKPKQHEYNLSTDPVDILRRKLKSKHKLRYGVDDTHMHEPPIHSSYETKAYLAKCKESIINITRDRNETIHKLSPDESAAINAVLWNLRTNELIIIKPADKNLGPTIMDRKWYISAGELILQDTHTYQAINSFNVNSIRNELILILHKFDHIKFKHNIDVKYGPWQQEDMFSILQNHISHQTPLAKLLLEPFLDPDLFQACRGYFLPKLHKLDTPFPINPPLTPGRTPPMRPICASIGWITYAVSVLLDILLKPLCSV
jgi:hypothetical protein